MAQPSDISALPAAVRSAVLVKSETVDISTAAKVSGYDFNKGLNLQQLLDQYKYMGFQATNFGLAVDEVNKMRNWSLAEEPVAADEDEELRDIEKRKQVKCKIFLGYTSNLISSGLRDIIRYLVEHKMVDVIVTTAGGVEEDLIKCMAPTFLGEFSLPGTELRARGLNRIGNLLVPNDNYCKFENWIIPVLDGMLAEQKADGTIWSPSKMIARFGKEINHPESVYYWAYKVRNGSISGSYETRNNIPVFCPAITDGSIGDMVYFHSYKNPGLIIDIAQDIRAINSLAVYTRRTGAIVLGGGLVKHHICNANLMRNGADYAVFINTGQEFDGSDAGASPDEAKSWGKIKASTRAVKVYGDTTLLFPLLVAQTFARDATDRTTRKK